MKYLTARALRTALESRLANDARADGLPIGRLRKRVAFERLLARLVVVAPEGWALKGAVALDFRIGVPARATNDLDLGASGKELIDAAIRGAIARELDDFFVFSCEDPSERKYDDMTTLRYSVVASLDDRRFETFHVDVGLTREFEATPERLALPALLGFADLPSIVVPTIPIEAHLADKVHALTRQRAPGRDNTRVKDLADVVLVLTTPGLSLDQEILARAIARLFGARTTHAMPATLPDPPVSWESEYATMIDQMGLGSDLRELANGLAVARETFEPALARARILRSEEHPQVG